MIDDDNAPEIELSPLSGFVTKDGVTVEVCIYRIAGSSAGWALEVVDDEGGATVWEELFPTDAEALREFEGAVEANGLASFRDAPSETEH